MKFGAVFRAFTLSAALLVKVAAQSGSPDDLYLRAYQSIQEGDELVQTGQRERARDRYSDAEANLKKLQSTYPNYNNKAVEFRLEYVRDRVKGLPAPKPADQPRSAVPVSPATATPNAQSDAAALLERVQALQTENASLQAKLQEALSPQPASVDPTEFARAQQRIQQLEKEKELLRVRADQAQAAQPQAADRAVLEQVRSELAASKQQVVENVASVAALTQERNQLLKDKSTLEARLAAAPAPQNNSRINELESERDALLKRVNELSRDVPDAKGRPPVANYETLTNQLYNLRARLEVYEARKVPFTAEELALLNKNVPKLASKPDVHAPKAAARELPPGAGLIVTDAERLFSQRRYAEAEEKYKQVLKMDEDNALSLANLAAIQLEMQKLNEADANLKKAIQIAPQDAYILSLLGMLRFQQAKYDEAFEALSRSAQLDPKNAETQNYLGITLSQQGQREAAESALRKAVALNPNYAGAHHNLAVIYATQRPPFLELARYHYNKALALGQSANPELEKQLGK